ncbi:MAG: GAF domain-containing protein [Herpetosiphonaceae bacterium]|nr:GAF domain-containing protein [Herpetosiphonaceae bacterium]
MTGWLARHRTTLRIGDMQQQRTVYPVRSNDPAAPVFRSFLGVPMLVGDELIGTLELGSDETNRFDAEDERLLKIIASQAAQALRNVRRYEATDEVLRERVRELLALQRISRELTSTLQLEQLLPAMLSEIVQATNCAHGMVVLREDDQQPFTVVAQTGYDDALDLGQIIGPLLTQGSLAHSLERAEPLIIDDISVSEPAVAWPNVRSVLLSPILYENRVAGAIIASDIQTFTFGHAAVDFVRAVADQAALAIGNAQHYAEQVRQRELLQQRASLLNEVLEIGNALRADMELNVLLEQIAFSVTEAAGFREVVFSLIDPDEPELLRTVTGAGLALSEIEARRGQPVAVSSIHPYLDPQYRIGRAYFVPASSAADASPEWIPGDKLLVPLYSTERELIGVMNVDDPFAREHPTRRVVETLEIFANQAAIAVENARLFSQRSRQIAELGVINRISRAATSSLDFDSLAREVYEVLNEALPVESYFLVVFNAAVDQVIESWGVDNGEAASNVHNGSIPSDSLTGWITQHAEPLLFSDLPVQSQAYTGMKWQPWGDNVPRSWVGMPLISGDGSIRGILSLQHNEPNRYSERDVELLRTVANQLAVAVENARLYGDTQRRLSELALVNRIGSLTSSTLNLVDILKEVYLALRTVLPIDAFFSFVYDPLNAEVVQRVNVDEGEFYIDSQRDTLLPHSPSAWITANLQSLIFSDMPTEIEGRFQVKRFGNPDKWVRSWIGVPLKISDDTSVGLISVQHYRVGMYGERELSLLQTVASQVALAVQNARLFNDRERQISELDAISQIGQLMSASFDLKEMLAQTAIYLRQVTGAPIFYTLVYDVEKNLITDGFAVEDGVVDPTPPRGVPLREGSLSGWVLRQRLPLIVPDLADREALGLLGIVPLAHAIEGHEQDPRSWVGLPIVAKDGAPIGMLSLQDYKPNLFDNRTVAFLTNVVSHVSLGLQKVQLFSERDRQIKELEAIRRVGQVTSSTLDLNEMAQGVYTVLTEFLPVEGFVLNVYDPQQDMLVYNLMIDRDKKLDVPQVRGVKYGSLTDWILTRRQPLLFTNLDADLKNYPEIAPMQHGQGPSAQSWMGVPLLDANDQPIGMLALQNYNPQAFDSQDMNFLSNVAYQVTLGMQNVRLYEQTQQGLQQLSTEAERLALINHVSNLTASTFDTQVLYNLAVAEMAHATGADQARLLVFDYGAQIGYTRAEFPSGDLSVQVPITDNLTIPWLQEYRRPLIINDIDTNELTASFRSTLHYLKIRRMMLVPLIVKGDMIGSVGLDRFNDAKEFTLRDAETCQTIANQVSQALENARLFAETERQAQALSSKVGELSVLLEAGQALSSTREPAQVLDTLVRLVARQLRVDTVVLSTISNDDLLVPLASLGLPTEFVNSMRVKRGEGLIGSVAETSQPLAVANVHEATTPSQYPDFNTKHGLISFLGVPVLYRSEVMGVLSVMTNTTTEFTADDIALLSALADQAAIALENSRLFAERERQITVLQALNDVTQAITSTLDWQTLLRQLHTRLGAVVDTRFSFIATYESESNTLSFPVVVDDHRMVEQESLPLAEGVLSRVVRGRRTIVLNTVEETAQASRIILGDDEPMASWVGIPIMLGEQVLGVINIQSHMPRAFPPEQVQFLQAVASQTAIALENARLFAERERQIAEAAILSSISQSITATLTPEELATSILAGLAPVFDTSNAYIVLYDAPSNMISTTVGFNDGAVFNIAPHLLTNDFLKTLLFEQQPLIFNSTSDQRAEGLSSQLPNIPGETSVEIQSVIAAPITMGSQTSGMMVNQPLGVLVVQSIMAGAFDQAQLRFLESVANQSSNAVQKAMLFTERERRIRELDTLNRISQSITSSINLEEILARLHTGLHEIVDMNTSYIGLYDAQTNMMTYEQTFDQGDRVFLPPGQLGVSTNAWVLEHRQPLLLNTAAEADEYRDEASRRRVVETRVGAADKIEQSYLIVPIIVGATALGVINIQSYEQYAFSEYDMGFASTVAAQAAASIANARLFDARERSIQQLRTLSSIGQALGSTVRFEDLLRVIYEQTSLLVDTSNFYLSLYDERHKEVSFPLIYEHGKPIRLEPQRGYNGLTEYIIRTRQPLLLQGDTAAQMEERGIQLIGDLARSWLGIPLIAADKVVGVMCVQTYTSDHAYSDDDVQLLSTVANQAAQALENARLFSESRESVRELSTLSETSVSLASSLDIAELLAISASSAIEMARADFGGVIVMETDGYRVADSLVLNRDRMDLPLPPPEEVNVSELLVLRPLRNGQIVTVYDANQEPSLAPLTTPLEIRGVVFLPIIRENSLRGVVFVGMDEPYTFEDRSVSSLLILSTQIGQAVNNAQLFEQIRRFNLELEEIVDQRTLELKGEKERVEALYNIATELGTTLDRDELLVRTLDMAATALSVSRGSVLLLDRETKQLICHAVLNEEMGLRSLETPVLLEGDGLANWVIQNNEGVFIDDVRQDSRWASAETGRGEDVRSVIAVPLLSSDTPQGVLMLNSTVNGYFTGDHLRFLSTIGGEVSSALHNADLYTLVYESADRLSDAMWQQREEASKTSAILQSVSEGVMVLDHDTERIILYNPAAEEVLRIPRSEVIDRSLSSVAAPRNEVELHEEGRALLLYTGLHEGIQTVHRDESVHAMIIELPGQMIAANFAPVAAEDGSRFGVVVVLRDITREIEADRAKRDFIATVSHELRTPLTPIRGFVDLLLLNAGGALNDAQRDMLGTVKANTMRMVSLVEDLLEIGRLEAGKISLNTAPSNINQMVHDTIAMWNLELQNKQMSLKLELDDTLPLIEYDSKRIGQVLTNLVSNAIKYTYAGGDVTVRTFRNPEGMIQLDVKDSGVGLTPDQQKSLFKRFYRADSPLRDEVGGTGLGLSIAKSFVELHNGEMWVQSVYGEGSTFSFSLPEHQPRPDLGEREDMGDVVSSVQPIEETTA